MQWDSIVKWEWNKKKLSNRVGCWGDIFKTYSFQLPLPCISFKNIYGTELLLWSLVAITGACDVIGTPRCVAAAQIKLVKSINKMVTPQLILDFSDVLINRIDSQLTTLLECTTMHDCTQDLCFSKKCILQSLSASYMVFY